ncbi:MAG: DUF1284 domain-containing protein [Clostridia bacterium]
MIFLRPHHLLCLQFFVGKGYDQQFTLNTATVLKKLQSGEEFTLVMGKDNLCSCCPNLIEGICNSGKSKCYDQAILDKTTLKIGQVYKIMAIKSIIADLINADKLDLCKDCQWIELCQSILKYKFLA